MTAADSSDNARRGAGSVTRRDFLKWSGVVIISVGAGGLTASRGHASMPECMGYLIVDSRKCQGCTTCMLACSLAHEGVASLSLSRLQVVQDPFEKFPDDIVIAQCRQCLTPMCVAACQTGALHIDAANGNIRTVDKERCIGCRACIEACPYTPGRTIWNFEQGYSQKCDLCASTPYWKEEGGPFGRQACVAYCPMQAIRFSATLPDEYDANLRDAVWRSMGYAMD